MRNQFDQELDDAFDECTQNEGVMNKEQFRAFVEKTNELCHKRNLKTRETTDEYIDLLWNCYAKWEQEEVDGQVMNETITKQTLFVVMREAAY